ncbi:MAG TPA: ROK family protein [Solirubrobacterales bacterium]|nr:ROK family protein [Solirubrobacterales bacterium]
MSESYIGIDVGGTKVAVAVLEGGELSHRGIQPTELGEADALVDEICSLVDSVRTESVRAVGIGVPSVVDFDAGRIRASVNIPLADLPLRDLLEERIGLPVFIDNDANVAALAEACSGGEIEVENLVMFTVGTGVGGGIVVNGRPYRGASGAAAELGHIMIGAELTAGAPEAGRFPQRGSLESLAAGRALDRLARDAAEQQPDSALGRLGAGAEKVDGHDVVAAAEDGDEVAVGLLRILGERLGIGIANVINSFDPDVVAIGGGVSTAGELLLEPARRAAEAYVLPGVGTKTEIRLSRYGPTAGVLGAAILAKHELTRREEGP